MNTLQGKLFIGVRVLYLGLVIIMMIGIAGAGAYYSRALIQGFVGLAIAFFLVRNYEKGSNWARIWMMIALYLSTAMYAWDFIEFTKLFQFPGFVGWGALGVIVDLTCITGSVFAVARVHREGPINSGLGAHRPDASVDASPIQADIVGSPSETWTCSECGFKNPKYALRCDNCGRVPPEAE